MRASIFHTSASRLDNDPTITMLHSIKLEIQLPDGSFSEISVGAAGGKFIITADADVVVLPQATNQIALRLEAWTRS